MAKKSDVKPEAETSDVTARLEALEAEIAGLRFDRYDWLPPKIAELGVTVNTLKERLATLNEWQGARLASIEDQKAVMSKMLEALSVRLAAIELVVPPKVWK